MGHDWSGKHNLFFPWPKTVEHVIDEDSPMYEMCKQATAGSHSSLNNKHHQSNKNPTMTGKCNKKGSGDFTGFTGMTDSTSISSGSGGSEKSIIKCEDYEIVVILEGIDKEIAFNPLYFVFESKR